MIQDIYNFYWGQYWRNRTTQDPRYSCIPVPTKNRQYLITFSTRRAALFWSQAKLLQGLNSIGGGRGEGRLPIFARIIPPRSPHSNFISCQIFSFSNSISDLTPQIFGEHVWNVQATDRGPTLNHLGIFFPLNWSDLAKLGSSYGLILLSNNSTEKKTGLFNSSYSFSHRNLWYAEVKISSRFASCCTKIWLWPPLIRIKGIRKLHCYLWHANQRCWTTFDIIFDTTLTHIKDTRPLTRGKCHQRYLWRTFESNFVIALIQVKGVLHFDRNQIRPLTRVKSCQRFV